MQIQDRFVRGLLAGVVSGILVSIIAIPLYFWTTFYDTRFMDFSAVMLFGHRPQGLSESILAWLGSVVWCGGWGIVTAYVFLVAGPKQYTGKGMYLGTILWFSFYTAASLFNKQTLIETPVTTTFINLFFSLLWGAVTGKLISYFEPHPAGTVI